MDNLQSVYGTLRWFPSCAVVNCARAQADSMKKECIRAAVIGAGTGSSGNVIRALRTVTPDPYIIGVHDDRFMLKLSLADRNYACPKPTSAEFVDVMVEIVRRERVNVVMPTDDVMVKALSDARDRFAINLLLPRRETIDLCQ